MADVDSQLDDIEDQLAEAQDDQAAEDPEAEEAESPAANPALAQSPIEAGGVIPSQADMAATVAAANAGPPDKVTAASLMAPDAAAELPTQPMTVKASPSSSSVSDYIAQRLAEQKEGLKDAQNKSNEDKLIANLAEGVGQIGAGLSRSNTFNPESYKYLHEAAENPVAQYIAGQKNKAASLEGLSEEDKIKAEELGNDPNSDEAKAARQVYAPTLKKLGIDPGVLDNMGSGQIKNFIQQPLEYQAKAALAESLAQQAREQKDANLEEKKRNNTLRDQEAKARIDQAKQQRDQMLQQQQDKADQKKDHDQNTALNQTQALLESARGNPAVAQAEKDVYASSKVKSLSTMYGDPNNLSPQMAALLRGEVGKIATGGSPSMHELEGLDAKPFQTSLSNIWQKFSNSPTPANAGAFLKQYQDYANSLSKDAQKTITDKYSRVIEPRKSLLGDDNYGNLKSLYVDRFNNVEIPKSSNAGGGHQPGDIVEVKGRGKFKVGADGDSLDPVGEAQ